MSDVRSYLRGVVLFSAGIVVGTVLIQPTGAQENIKTGLRLNHVGIAVKDMQESLNFNEKVMGFRFAFGGGTTPDTRQATESWKE